MRLVEESDKEEDRMDVSEDEEEQELECIYCTLIAGTETLGNTTVRAPGWDGLRDLLRGGRDPLRQDRVGWIVL